MDRPMENLEKLVEVLDYTGEEYQPVLGFRDWRVAILNYADSMLPENIKDFTKHCYTDEVFVALKGKCILFLAEDETLEKIHAVELEPYKVYNVKQGIYHNHTLSKDAKVLIVESDDTCEDNSPTVPTHADVNRRLIEMTKEINK